MSVTVSGKGSTTSDVGDGLTVTSFLGVSVDVGRVVSPVAVGCGGTSVGSAVLERVSSEEDEEVMGGMRSEKREDIQSGMEIDGREGPSVVVVVVVRGVSSIEVGTSTLVLSSAGGGLTLLLLVVVMMMEVINVVGVGKGMKKGRSVVERVGMS